MGTLDDLFVALDGTEFPRLGLRISADDDLASIDACLERGDLAGARTRLDSAIFDAGRARRARLLDAVVPADFDHTGYLVALHCRRAQLHRRAGDFAAAREDLVLAHILDPGHPTPRPNLVEVYVQEGRVDLAISLLRRMYREDPAGLGFGVVRLAADVRRGGATLTLVAPMLEAVLENDTGGLLEKVAECQLALFDNPVPSLDEIASFYQDAVAALTAGRLDDVEGLVLPVLAWAPQLAIGWFFYGIATRIRQDVEVPDPGSVGNVLHAADQAASLPVTALTIATYLEPDRPEHWAELARAQLMTSRFDEAVSAALRAVRLAPDDAASHALLAAGLLYTERLDEGMSVLLRALELDAEQPVAQHLLGWLAALDEAAP